MVFDTPPDGAATLRDGRLNGAASFVHAPPGCAAYVVYAAGSGSWERVVVPRDAPGLIREDVGRRTGLAAVEVAHLSFADVQIPTSRHLTPATPTNYLRCLMLGLAAIALGNARGALRAAHRYAQERHQGGGNIEGHAAVQILLGESRSRITAAAAHLAAAANANGSAATWCAVAAKLQVTAQCHRAVSDCLQVLGGYGYMEDYRLEKRLRDAMMLTVEAIDPNTLRLMCADDPGGM
jgi:alkylation response protein AidB-like acyl-CoA dehydrogenase